MCSILEQAQKAQKFLGFFKGVFHTLTLFPCAGFLRALSAEC